MRPVALLPILAAPLLTSCARMAPQRVADGIAQLTVRDLAGVLLAVNGDASCGFASDAVLQNPAIAGDLNETGTATWTVESCVIDLGPEPVELSTDCNGVVTTASGKVTVSARKVVTGRVTGSAESPVIPETPDAATFHIDQADFSDFVVAKSNSESQLRILEGSLQAAITPQLAAAASNGACSVITPHIAFDDVRWGPSVVEVTSGGRQFEVPVRGGSLTAVNGTIGERENHVEGTLSIWGTDKPVLLSGPTAGLDPDYDAALLEDSFSCKEELVQPITYTCDLDPRLAVGTARLIVKNFGLFSKTVDLDEECGFGNFMGQVSELISFGTIGGLLFGTPQTFHFDADSCLIGGPMSLVTEDCVDTSYILDGTARVSGTKSVTGIISLDDDPLQPQDRHSALVVLDRIVLDEVTPLERPAGTTVFEPHLTMHDGTLSGVYNPVTGEAADDPGSYFIVIPVGEFEQIRLVDSDVTLHQGDLTFPMHIDDSELYAFNGRYEGDGNWLHGWVTIDGTTWQIGEDGAIPLDPDFDQDSFDASYECIDNLLDVVPSE